jgi:hypothetical protein
MMLIEQESRKAGTGDTIEQCGNFLEYICWSFFLLSYPFGLPFPLHMRSICIGFLLHLKIQAVIVHSILHRIETLDIVSSLGHFVAVHVVLSNMLLI